VAVALQTFADKNPPWQLSLLDANFAQIEQQLNSGLLGTLYLVDTSNVANILVVQLPAGVVLTLQAGVFLQVRAANTNTTSPVTLDIQGVGTNSIVNPPANFLGIGQIQQGGLYGLQFDGTNWQLVSASGPGGVFEPAFQSGSVQINDNGSFGGFGNFQFGFALPNASGIPSQGILVGGAGASQVVYITDAQLPGQKGIIVIREAGDAGDTTSAGGDLLDFAGASINSFAGTSKYQGGTSVHGAAGPASLVGGSSTDGTPGNAVVEAGQTGTAAGATCQYIATQPPGAPGYGVHRWQFNSNFCAEWQSLYQLYLYFGNGYGLAGQPLVSGGPGGPLSYQVAYSGTKVINGDTYVWSSGILKTINGQIV
jgi:hypothetical protein